MVQQACMPSDAYSNASEEATETRYAASARLRRPKTAPPRQPPPVPPAL
jgi:hypothetical protein